MDLMEDKKDKDLTYLTFIDKIELVCKFCTEVILAKKNSGGYLRSFVAYKAQKLLIILKNTFISVIY